jgi:hypothetical protein
MLRSLRVLLLCAVVASTTCVERPVRVVPIHVHNIVTSKGAGHVSDGRIRSQLAVLNTAYGPAKIQFELASVERVVNDQWSKMEGTRRTRREIAMLSHLGRDTYTSLNFYIVPEMDSTWVGKATFPWNLEKSPRLDGVIVVARSLPGKELRYQGHIAVHEVGHWLGLEHTFEGGCTGLTDDSVSDTPRERGPSYTCDRRDTCPGERGFDSTDNFMNYGTDLCPKRFTSGQIARMRRLLVKYRPSLARLSTGTVD